MSNVNNMNNINHNLDELSTKTPEYIVGKLGEFRGVIRDAHFLYGRITGIMASVDLLHGEQGRNELRIDGPITTSQVKSITTHELGHILIKTEYSKYIIKGGITFEQMNYLLD